MKAAAVALAAGLAALALPAHAQNSKPDPVVQHTDVTYGDLDLSTAKGARAMYTRIQSAARRVCGQPSKEIEEKRAFDACVASAANQAVADLDSPLVTALHQDKQRGSEQFASARSRTD